MFREISDGHLWCRDEREAMAPLLDDEEIYFSDARDRAFKAVTERGEWWMYARREDGVWMRHSRLSSPWAVVRVLVRAMMAALPTDEPVLLDKSPPQ